MGPIHYARLAGYGAWVFRFLLPQTGIIRCTVTLVFYVGAGDEAVSTLLTEVSPQPPARKF